jgi:predicted PurR-regulated permease PerM
MAAIYPSDERTGIVRSRGSPARGRKSSRLAALAWVTGGLCVLSLAAILPLGAPLLIAAWMAIVISPLCERIAARVRQRRGAAALLSVGLVLLVLGPMSWIALSLSASALELAQRLSKSKTGSEALQALIAGDNKSALELPTSNLRQGLSWLQSHAGGVLDAASTVFGAATAAVIGLVVFVGGFYAFLVNGRALYRWLLERSPLGRVPTERFAAAFAETGRGLLIGVGLTALLQGTVATIGYLVTGVPQALVLGLVTVFASLIPSLGSGLVWVPVTAGLALGGRPAAAAVMLAIGLFVSVVDNLVRPVLSRYGKLELPGFLLFVAMLGGIAAFGAVGLFVGPLFVRLAIEGLNTWKVRQRTA